ncbi:MAG: ABC transporter permease subunit, partial [Bacteroidota bacterium]
MLKYIFKYELAHWLRSPLTYGFVVIFFALAFVLLIGTAGYFDGPPSADVQVSFLNTPFELTKMGNFFFKIMMFTIPVFVGNAIFRDYDSRTFSILYAFPISKKDYLWGKFGSGFL